jgi:hypothetical protein
MINKKRGVVIALVILAIYTLLVSLVDITLIVKILSVGLATSLTVDLLGLLLYKGYFKNTMLRTYLMGERVKVNINRGFKGYGSSWPAGEALEQEFFPATPLDELIFAPDSELPEYNPLNEMDKAVYDEKKTNIVAGVPLEDESDYQIALAILEPYSDMSPEAVLTDEEDRILETVLDSVMNYSIEKLKAQ